MASIRPFERADLPAVASLYELVARSGSRMAAPGLERYFEDTFFDHPWADPEIPSLVFVDDDGGVGGFIGSSVRRLEFRGAPIRLGVAGQLVTEPKARNRAAGMFLMKEYLAGAQDLTVTDTASDVVERIWARLGGDTLHIACVGWARVFRPFRFAGDYAAGRDHHVRARTARGLGRVLDPIARRAATPWSSAPTRPPARTEPLTSAAVVEHLPSLTSDLELRTSYDAPFAEWLLGEAAKVKAHGTLVAELVRDGDGQVAGWYVYYDKPRAIGAVLQVAARRESAPLVLQAMFWNAASRGATGLQGRVDGLYRDALSRAGCVFHPSGFLALAHARDERILHALHSGRSLLTRLEGEWWMGHHLDAGATVA